MSNDSKSSIDEVAVDAVADESRAATRRPSPSAQAASRARRIGGRPQPGSRATPAGSTDTDPTAPAPAKTPKPARAPKSANGAAGESTAPPRGGGMRAARASTAEPLAEAKQRAVSLDKRSAGKAARVIEPGSEPDAAALRRKLDRVRWIPAAVLGAGVAVLAVLCVLLGHGVWWGAQGASEVRGQVLSAAKTCTASVGSYDYRKLAQSKKAGLACVTGKFKTDYATAMDTIVAKEAPTTKTTQTLQVAKAGIEQVSSDGKQWTVLVYGQHTVTNTATGTKTPRLDKLSVRVTMDKVGGKWLIAQLDLAAS